MRTILLVGLTCAVISSCKKFVEIDPPPTIVTNESIFSSEETAMSALIGLYGRIGNEGITLFEGGMSIYAGLSSDELSLTNSDPTYIPYLTNGIATNDYSNITYLWSKAYSLIYHANAFIDGLNASVKISEEPRRQLAGEAKFLRAFFYFYLVNLYGDVPLLLNSDYSENAKASRAPVNDVYDQIEIDLADAIENLPSEYLSAGRIRANKLAALALSARVALYRGHWAEAEERSTSVLNDARYLLEPDLNNVFLVDSGETIWSCTHFQANTVEASIFVPFLFFFMPPLAFTPQFLASLELGDQRATNWMMLSTAGGQQNYYPYKYKVINGTNVIENTVMLRLAEQYLIRAEARAQLGSVEAGETDVNIIRARAGLSPINVTSREDLLSGIEQERRIEFMAEWGHRWLDLKRTGKANAILSAKGSNWSTEDQLYPIPLSEIQLNPALKQNAGY